MNCIRHRLFIVSALVASLLAAGCTESGSRQLEREDLFQLELGKLDDQIDLFQLGERDFRFRNRIASRDGRVYVSNGNAGKVMEFTAYGDLLSLLFDPVTNPPPSLPEQEDDRSTTRVALSHSFNNLGEIAVGSGRKVYVEDRIRDGGEYDSDLGVHLRSRIFVFEAGRYSHYLGQEGIGGVPFPYIEEMEVTPTGEIVVVTRTKNGRRVYWYTAEGDFKWEVPISNDRLPLPDDDNLVPSLGRIFPDLEQQRLYLKLDYYERTPVEGGPGDPGNVFSRVYVLDLEEGRYIDSIEIPEYTATETPPPDFEPVDTPHLYRFVGVGPDGHLFFTVRGNNGTHELLILSSDGHVVARREIVLEEQPLHDLALSVSPEGILTALLAREDGAQVAWWRTDRLIDN
ncbi:MAG: LIC_12708 family protein [Spirochaetota bacterium]